MSPLVTASCSQGEVLCSGNGPQERFTTSIMWQSDICRGRFQGRWCRKRSICWRWRCLRRCCCNIPIYDPRKEQFGAAESRFWYISCYTTLSWLYQKRLGKLSYRHITGQWKIDTARILWCIVRRGSGAHWPTARMLQFSEENINWELV